MLLGAIVGIAVENLEESGYGKNHLSAVREEKKHLPGETAGNSNIKNHGDHTQNEPAQGKYKDAHTSLLGRLLDEFVTVFRAAANGLTPNLILFVFLPILVFESAYNMEARQVIKNLLPITVLALPGLLLSTVMCGVGVMLAGRQDFGITWEVALLFGVIVSATDPVAVVGLFKELGAPKRLSILVEGESLFNDGTAIVLFNILIAFVLGTTTAGKSFAAAFYSGTLEFLKVSGGGALVGILLAWIGWNVIGSIIENLSIKISLTIVMTYASFVIAEHAFHVSGVIAVVLAGLASGSYGQIKLSQSMLEFIKEFWEFLAFVMNSLIFFLVGLVIALRLDVGSFIAVLPLLVTAIVTLIIARALSIFGAMPLLERLMEAVDSRYQAVMFWGGLRGAVGLALALTVVTTDGIPLEIQQIVLTLTAGVVLFTLLVNALTIEPLIVMLGLNRPTVVDRFAMEHGELVVCDDVLQVLNRMEQEKLMAPNIIEEFRAVYRKREKIACERLAELRKEADKKPGYKDAVAGLLALAVEKREVLARFSDGSISEIAAKSLLNSSDRLLDTVKSGEPLPEIRPLEDSARYIRGRLLTFLELRSIMNWLVRLLRSKRMAEKIEIQHGLYIAARGVDRNLQGMEDARTIDLKTLGRIQARFLSWEIKAQQQISRLTEEFPENVRSVQKALAEHEVMRVEARSLHHLKEVGLLTEKAWAESLENILRLERILQDKLRTGA
jgi:CPA1 family monovalent cation:H+ antiporter